MILQRLVRLYALSLRLYPRSHQAEFAEEMREVFAQAALEARSGGPLRLGKLCLRELTGLLASLAQAHWLVYRHRKAAREAAFQVRSLDGSWRELLLALAVFLLPAVIGLVNGTLPAAASSGSLPAGLFLVVMIVIGWLGGHQLRSSPYLGIILAVAGYLHLFQWVVRRVSPSLISSFSPGPWDHSAYLLLEVVSTGMVWLMLFCLTLLLVALLAVFNRFQPFLTHLGHDWTLLSYVLYGESVFALLLLFESHRSDPVYTAAGLICLAAGVWYYQRCPGRRQRLLALLACLTLAVGVAALENQPSAPGLGWFTLDQGPAPAAGRLLLSWLGMVAALLLPGLLSRLPFRPAHHPSVDR